MIRKQKSQTDMISIEDNRDSIAATFGNAIQGELKQNWPSILDSASTTPNGVATVTFTCTIVTSGFREPHTLQVSIRPRKALTYRKPLHTDEQMTDGEISGMIDESEFQEDPGIPE